MSAAFSPELHFVIACCRRPDDAGRRPALEQAARAISDWDEVARLAQAHRIEGLVADGVQRLTEAPIEAPAFAATAERVKRQALEDLGETLRLSRALDDAGARHAILKGVPLGLQAFGTPVLKQSWDIDLLVAPADAVAAAGVIGALGYAPHVPPRAFTQAEFRRWSGVSKEAEFRSPAGRTVELHWAVCDHPMLLPDVSVAAANKRVELLDGAAVPVLRDSANLAYLAVHGAAHGWSRLKWLADFHGLLSGRPAAERSEIVAQARTLGTGHALDQALTLSRDLLGGEGAPGGSVEALALAELARTIIDRRGRTSDFDGDPAVGYALGQSRRRLMSGARYRLILAYVAIKGSEDRRLIPLPRALGWVYWLMRPFSATVRTGIRRVRRERNRPCDRA